MLFQEILDLILHPLFYIPVGLLSSLVILLLRHVWKTNLVKRYDDDYKTVLDTKHTVRVIERDIVSLLHSLGQTVLYYSQSPLGLTSAGRKIVRAVQIEPLILQHIDWLKKTIDYKNLETDAECESKCFDISLPQWQIAFGKKKFNEIQNVLYTKGLLEGEVQRILGIVARNTINSARKHPAPQIIR